MQIDDVLKKERRNVYTNCNVQSAFLHIYLRLLNAIQDGNITALQPLVYLGYRKGETRGGKLSHRLINHEVAQQVT